VVLLPDHRHQDLPIHPTMVINILMLTFPTPQWQVFNPIFHHTTKYKFWKHISKANQQQEQYIKEKLCLNHNHWNLSNWYKIIEIPPMIHSTNLIECHKRTLLISNWVEILNNCKIMWFYKLLEAWNQNSN